MSAFGDTPALLWLNSFMGRWPLLDKGVLWLLDADFLTAGVLVAMVCFLWFQTSAKQTARRIRLVAALVSSLVALLLGRGLALALPFRERPYVNLDILVPPNFAPSLRTWSSFPSDHAMMAFALSTGLWLIHRPIGLFAFVFSTLSICLPRVYFGLHYPSDIIGGAVIGVLVALFFNREAVRRPISQYALAIEERFSGLFYACFFLLLFQYATMFSGMRSTVAAFFRLLHGHE